MPPPARSRTAPGLAAPDAPNRPARSYRWPTIGELWTFLGFALPALAALLVPMPAVDLTYQLRAGGYILAFGQIPAFDTWTFTADGQPWVDQQWGAQAILAAVFEAAGWTGLAILRATLVATAFALVQATLRTMGCAQRPAALLALGSFAIAAPALALRPQLFGLVLFAASLYVVTDRRAHPRRRTPRRSRTMPTRRRRRARRISHRPRRSTAQPRSRPAPPRRKHAATAPPRRA